MIIRKYPVYVSLSLALSGSIGGAAAQVLTLKEAVQTAITNYGTIRAKANYLKASKEAAIQTKREYLPNLSVSAQQDYGTVNGQNGPLYGLNGLAVASSGAALAHQNWNAAFGALYLANLNWDFFAFGRTKEKIKTFQAAVTRDQADWQQEQFQQEVRVAGAYLNLLAAQRLTHSWETNLSRADTLLQVVATRAKNGLIPGVDSSQAIAEVSSARIALTNARDQEQSRANELAQLMGIPAPDNFVLDTQFVSKIPSAILDPSASQLQDNPVLKYYKSRVDLSNEQTKYYRTLNYPVFTLFSVFQSRGSGFDANYSSDQSAFTHNYGDGIKPTRSNYLLGLGFTWNLTSPLRVSHQVAAQKYTTLGLQDEYDLINQRLQAQLVLSASRIKNALANYHEAPIQVQSASDTYLQRSVLYKNGLSNIVDMTQALYTVNRAETDRDIAFTNVWQALLLKAAAIGDFGIFINEF